MSDCRWGVRSCRPRPEVTEYVRTDTMRGAIHFKPDGDYEMAPKPLTVGRLTMDGDEYHTRVVDRFELDGTAYLPERTCTMTRGYEGHPCYDFTCSACGKTQCVGKDVPRLVAPWHCQRCGARVTKLVDSDGNELPMHEEVGR